MNSRRTVILIVAVVVGGIASFGLLNYIRNVEGAVYDNAEPEQIWVVRRPIPKGTTAEQVINQQLIEPAEIPGDFRPATAIVDPEAELAGLVAVTDLPVNAPLVTGNFVAPSVVNTGITDRLEERGMVTVTFSVDQVKGAAFLVEPGDQVNILSLKKSGRDEGGAEAEGGEEVASGPASSDEIIDDTGTYDYVVRYIYQQAEVLAVDRSLTPDLGETADEAEGAARNGGLITLAVPPDAVQVILSVGMENIYLSLLPPSYEIQELPPIDYLDPILPGEDLARLTPYGPEGSAEEAK